MSFTKYAQIAGINYKYDYQKGARAEKFFNIGIDNYKDLKRNARTLFKGMSEKEGRDFFNRTFQIYKMTSKISKTENPKKKDYMLSKQPLTSKYKSIVSFYVPKDNEKYYAVLYHNKLKSKTFLEKEMISIINNNASDYEFTKIKNFKIEFGTRRGNIGRHRKRRLKKAAERKYNEYSLARRRE